MERAGPRLRAAVVPAAILLVGCTSSVPTVVTPTEPSPTSATAPPSASPSPSSRPVATLTLRDFPPFPRSPLPASVADPLQAVLDRVVEDGTVGGVTAAIVVVGSGSWAGASGVDLEGAPLTPQTRLLTGSVGKTVTAAQILRLVDEGDIGLDDPITDHLPAKTAAAFDANGATVRDALGMRSGIEDPSGYVEAVDAGATPIELLGATSISSPAGSEVSYANINYILLGLVIEHVTGRPLWDALRSGVLDAPGLDGLTSSVEDALAADGWGVGSDAPSLARWGYELYGGSVVSDASLRAMTDFHGAWYGLGTIDYALGSPAEAGYDVAAIGHGGLEPPSAAVLLTFPETGIVVAVQTPSGDLDQVHAIVRSLMNALEP